MNPFLDTLGLVPQKMRPECLAQICTYPEIWEGQGGSDPLWGPGGPPEGYPPIGRTRCSVGPNMYEHA